MSVWLGAKRQAIGGLSCCQQGSHIIIGKTEPLDEKVERVRRRSNTIVLNRADIGFGKAFSCQLSLRQTTLAAQMSNDLAK